MAAAQGQEGSAVPASAKGSWSSFLRSIASFSGDLSSLTAPPFILSGTSLVEFSAYWSAHPTALIAPAKESDPTKRALLVLVWFLTTLKQQYASRSEKLGSEKKPLNPFLGELFLGKWEERCLGKSGTDDKAGDKQKVVEQAGVGIGDTHLVSEQVSHHPPVTAYCVWNDNAGVQLQGYNGQKTSITKSLTISLKQIGHATLHIDAYDEDYLITLPALHVEGIYSGSPFIELEGSSHIVSSSGYQAKIDYTGRGWLSGKKNSFNATLSKSGASGHKGSEILYTITGQWTEAFQIVEGKGGKTAKAIDEWSPKNNPTTPLTVAPIEEQEELESRRAWQQVAQGIAAGDMDATSHFKSIIENSQRELRKKEKEEGREWDRRYFSRAEKHPVFEKLAPVVHEQLEGEKTNGVWRWDAEKAKAARSSAPPA